MKSPAGNPEPKRKTHKSKNLIIDMSLMMIITLIMPIMKIILKIIMID